MLPQASLRSVGETREPPAGPLRGRDLSFHRLAAAETALLLLLSGSPNLPAQETVRVERARYLMGTIFRFEAISLGEPRIVGSALGSALDEVARLETVLSNWRSDSELSQANRRAGETEVAISPDLFDSLSASLFWSRESDGFFDPTVEPLTRRFRSGDPSSGGDAGSGIAGSPRRGDWRGVHLNRTSRTLRFSAGVSGLDLGGIGKGYALDRAAAVLREHGIRAALLDAGGQILALGAPPGERGWPVAIADPGDRERPAVRLLLRDVSASTSGNSERPGEIVDPRDGRTIRDAGSVTAITPDGTSADALSTALFVMGRSRGLRWTEKRKDLVALYLEPSDRPRMPPVLLGSIRLPSDGRVPLIESRLNFQGGRFVHAF